MKNQIGARYLFRIKHRQDETFNGRIAITNSRYIRLPNGNIKRQRKDTAHELRYNHAV